MKANMTEVELNQELQKLADQLPIEARLLIFELMMRYASANAVLKTLLPDYRYGYLDVLSTLTPHRRDMSDPNKKH
ncbi:hypothetical protein PO486_08610 [Atlantibacter hermannii]|uniref:hypothetical protein n=1 Tax=Atlantibacter hermannii TaxID=565 RepID=UPI002FF5C6D8